MKKCPFLFLLWLAALYPAVAQPLQSATIGGRISIPGCDTLLFVLTRCPTVVVDATSYEESLVQLGDDGRFSIHIDSLSMPFYFNLQPLVNGIPHHLVSRGERMPGMPGDSICVDVFPDRTVVGGKGGEKLRIQLLHDSISYWPGPEPKAYAEDMDTLVLYQRELFHDSIYSEKSRILANNRQRLSPTEYELMAIDLRMGRKNAALTQIVGGLILSPVERYRNYLKHLFWREIATMDGTGPPIAPYSAHYSDVMFKRIYIAQQLKDRRTQADAKVNMDSLITRVVGDHSGLLREKLLIGVLKYNREKEKQGRYLQRIAPFITTPVLRHAFESYAEVDRSTQPMATIKHFSFADAEGNTVDSNALIGRITFVDLWYTGCAACAKAKTQLVPLLAEKRTDPRFQTITISIDDRETWLKSLKKGLYTDEQSINTYTDGLRSRHPFIQYYQITGYPAFFLVDEQGRIIRRTQGVSQIEDSIRKL